MFCSTFGHFQINMSNQHFLQKMAHGAWLKLKSTLANPYSELGLSWAEVKSIKHQSAGKERKTTVNGHRLYYISPNELIHGLQEIFLEKVYAQSFGPQPYILDCGANIGMSAICFKQIAPDAVIEAFEPDIQNFDLLQKNIASFGLQQVTLHKKAIWKAQTTLQFEADGMMSSKIGSEHSTAKKMVEVEAVRLKDYLNRPVDFLKMDIEGAEYEVLKDAKDSLHLVKSMFVEYHGSYAQNGELLEILSIMHTAGFSFYIKEATSVYDSPLNKEKKFPGDWDVQLNIFCIRK